MYGDRHRNTNEEHVRAEMDWHKARVRPKLTIETVGYGASQSEG